MERWARDLPLARRLGCRAMRVDVGLGWPDGPHPSHLPGVFGDAVTSDQEGAPLYNTSAVLELSRLLLANGMTPLYSWAYARPAPVQAGRLHQPAQRSRGLAANAPRAAVAAALGRAACRFGDVQR